MAVLHTGHGQHVSYLTSQISKLAVEAGSIMPHITVNSQSKRDFVQTRRHLPQTGDPTRQLRNSILAILQLLNELEDMPRTKLDAATVAEKMGMLSLNLSDLGLREEALEVQTIVVALRRPRKDVADLGSSLNNLSARLSGVGLLTEALEIIKEATDIYRKLDVDSPDVFRPELASSLNNLSILLTKVGRREEALEMTTKATSICRILAADRPDTFR